MLNYGEIIANNIRAERNRTKMSQEEVSNLLTNISLKTYNNYEKNAKNVCALTLLELSNIFECNIDAFFVGTKYTKCEQSEG